MPPEPAPADVAPPGAAPAAPARATPVNRVTITADGPVLVEGPVELVLPDGTTTLSQRPVTAVCVCGNSRRYPLCDTSHRRRVRTTSKEQ